MRGEWVRKNEHRVSTEDKQSEGPRSWTGTRPCECETVGLWGNEASTFRSLGRTQPSRRSLDQRCRDSYQ